MGYGQKQENTLLRTVQYVQSMLLIVVPSRLKKYQILEIWMTFICGLVQTCTLFNIRFVVENCIIRSLYLRVHNIEKKLNTQTTGVLRKKWMRSEERRVGKEGRDGKVL